MTSQIKYNTQIAMSFLQVYIAMMEGEKLTLDYYKELTGLSEFTYYTFLNDFKEMIDDLRLSCILNKFEIDNSNDKTEYKTKYYTLSGKVDYSFELPDDLPEDKRITYSAVIVYLILKNYLFVKFDYLDMYLPNFNRKKLFTLLEKMRDIIGEELYITAVNSYKLRGI